MKFIRKAPYVPTLKGMPSYWEPTLADEIEPARLLGPLGNIYTDEKTVCGEGAPWRRSCMLRDTLGHLRGQAFYQSGALLACDEATYAPGTSKVLVDLLLGALASDAILPDGDLCTPRMLRLKIGRLDIRFTRLETKPLADFWIIRWDERQCVSRSPGIELAYRAIVDQFDRNVWRSLVANQLRMKNRSHGDERAAGPRWSVLEICRMGAIEHGAGERIEGFDTFEAACEFARRRTRESVEGCRRVTHGEIELRREWMDSGSDYLVIGATREEIEEGMQYAGSDELDDFIRHPALGKEIDWRALVPLAS